MLRPNFEHIEHHGLPPLDETDPIYAEAVQRLAELTLQKMSRVVMPGDVAEHIVEGYCLEGPDNNPFPADVRPSGEPTERTGYFYGLGTNALLTIRHASHDSAERALVQEVFPGAAGWSVEALGERFRRINPRSRTQLEFAQSHGTGDLYVASRRLDTVEQVERFATTLIDTEPVSEEAFTLAAADLRRPGNTHASSRLSRTSKIILRADALRQREAELQEDGGVPIMDPADGPRLGKLARIVRLDRRSRF
jgi:hypothetical protein